MPSREAFPETARKEVNMLLHLPIAILATLSLVAVSDTVPKFDTVRECSFEGGPSVDVARGSRDGAAALRQLQGSWAQYTDADRLGRLDDSVRALLMKDDVEGLRAALKRIAGEDGLAIHYVALHGDLPVLKGKRRPLTAYYIGNVLSAVEMTKVNPAAGLYAPLRVVVYANEQGGTAMEYDRPTSMFGQFKNAEIDEMAQSLDQRLLTFLKKMSM
jgi:uncharacterized protein (DUF302 family)